MSTNQTTYENFRYSYGRGDNPYDRGVLRNCLEVWCAPRLPRKVDFRAYADEMEAAVDRDGRALPGKLPRQGEQCCCANDVEGGGAAGGRPPNVQLSARGM